MNNDNISFFLIQRIFFFCFFIFALFSPCVVFAAVGISPDSIELPNILKETTVKQTVVLSRSNVDTEMKVLARMVGSQASAISGATELVFPVGVQELPYDFTISTKGLPQNQSMNATLQFLFLPNTESGGMNIALSLSCKIAFRVIAEHVEESEVKQVQHKTSDKGEFEMSLFFINSGNFEAKPSSVEILLKDNNTFKTLETISISKEEIALTPAYSSQNLVFKIKHSLPTGNYLIETKVMRNSEVVFESSQRNFELRGNVWSDALHAIGRSFYLFIALAAAFVVLFHIRKYHRPKFSVFR